jgi:hypothetical protein
VIGWLMWNTMRLLAGLGLTILGGGVVLLIWFMFDVGFAWISFVFLGTALGVAFFFLRRVYLNTRPTE